MSWYVAIAKNGRALKALDELTEHGYCVVCPLVREYGRTHRGVRTLKESPALLRYLIISAEEHDLPTITACWHIDSMLKDEEGPVVLWPSEVDAVIELDGSGVLDRTSREARTLSEGQMVRLCRGLFEGVVGRLIKHRGHGKWQVELTNAYGHGAGKMVASEDEVEEMAGEQNGKAA